jgi:2'-5' RNA ligase
MARCFVALWPDAATRERLHAIAAGLASAAGRARPTSRDDLHLTLAFLGELDTDRACRVASMLAAMDEPAFDWSIDSIGSFAGAGVVWAGSTPNQRLDALVRAIRSGLEILGVPYDSKPFLAHVTLLRGTVPPQAATRVIAPPIRWTVLRPILVRSDAAANGKSTALYRPWIFDSGL